MHIDGTTAVVTGASSGIGAATAEALAREGAQVALLARTESDLQEVAERIERDGGTAAVFPVDLSDADEIGETAARIRDELDDPDILVNNAGIGSWVSVTETEPGQAEAMVDVPYLAAFHLGRSCPRCSTGTRATS